MAGPNEMTRSSMAADAAPPLRPGGHLGPRFALGERMVMRRGPGSGLYSTLLLFSLLLLVLSGVFLAMAYVPARALAFASFQDIARHVNYGWLLDDVHGNVVSLIFAIAYVHLFRGLWHRRYLAQPAGASAWVIDVLVLTLLLAAGFTGAVLPWSKLSAWAATFFANPGAALPAYGSGPARNLFAGESVPGSVLTRDAALHDLFALAILALVAARLWVRHEALRPLATPATSDVRRGETVRFYPHATTRMALWLCVYLLVLTVLVFFLPRWLGQGSALIAADQPVAPLGGAVIPPWYFLPLYGIVQAVPDRIGAILLALGALAALGAAPWLDAGPAPGASLGRSPLVLLLLAVLVITIAASQPPAGFWVFLARLSILYYFFYFLVILPSHGRQSPGLVAAGGRR